MTTDSLGATPNINLSWGTGAAFEYHNSSIWNAVEDQSGAETDTNIVQLNMSKGTRTITFTPDAGFGVKFGSVDFGIASSNGNDGVFTVDIITDFGLGTETTEKTVSTASLTRDEAATLNLSFTGAVDEVYTLQFANNGGDNYGALDDLSFGQVPEPSAFGLLAGMFGFTWVMLRRRRA